MKIGFIGLGIMGRPMAKNLINAGHDLQVYDIDERAVEALSACGAQAAASVGEAASGAGIVITMLPDGPQVKEVALGDEGVIRYAKPGSLLIDMSSISPVTSVEIAEALRARGIRMLDAPVSGAYAKALDGTLSIMVGGDPADFEDALPVLKAMGTNVTLIGPSGSGSACKLANQIIIASGIAAVGEAFMLAKLAGCDLRKVFQAVRTGFAGSILLDSTVPRMMDGNFRPGFKIDLHLKDIRNAVTAGEACGAPLPLARHMLEVLGQLSEEGEGALDNSGIVRYYEKLAGTTFQDEVH